MVFLTLWNYASKRIPGPDKFWRKRLIFKQTAHFSRRNRQCYRIAIKHLHKAWRYATQFRGQRREAIQKIWETRLDGACAELNTSCPVLLEGLARSDILLDRKVLNDLAIWEPRTFKCVTEVAATKFNLAPPRKARLTLDPIPEGVITRGML